MLCDTIWAEGWGERRFAFCYAPYRRLYEYAGVGERGGGRERGRQHAKARDEFLLMIDLNVAHSMTANKVGRRLYSEVGSNRHGGGGAGCSSCLAAGSRWRCWPGAGRPLRRDRSNSRLISCCARAGPKTYHRGDATWHHSLNLQGFWQGGAETEPAEGEIIHSIPIRK